MPGRPQHSVNRHGGFTLVEILVVIVLISITATLAIVNMHRDIDRVAELEAKQFRSLLEILREESVITGKLMGVKIDPGDRTYHFVSHTGSWDKLSNDDVFRERGFTEGIKVKFETRERPGRRKSKKNKDKKNRPPSDVIMVEPLGSVTPFTLVLQGDDLNWVVSLDEDQNIVVKSKDGG